MRSLTSRTAVEWTARAVVLAAVAALLLRAFGAAEDARTAQVSSAGLPGALREWTLDPSVSRAAVSLDAVPPAVQRRWLRALARAGVRIQWNGDVTPLAIGVSAAAAPTPAYQIRVAAGGSGGGGALADDLGTIAALPDGARLHVVRAPAVAGTAHVVHGRESAHATAPGRPRIGRVAVMGPAGWESKFAVRALEEAGWTVDVRLDVAPGVSVGSFSPSRLDTARYSAAVVFARVPEGAATPLTAFARSGGGVVLAGDAAARAGPMSPAATARRIPVRYPATVAHASLGGLVFPALRESAVAIESNRGAASVAGRRVGAGRIVAVGYDETWRWRMQGGATGPREHAHWWSGVVGGVAYAVDTSAARAPGDPAPLAALHAALGPPAAAAITRPSRRVPADALLYGLAVLALIAEVLSRRRRGLA